MKKYFAQSFHRKLLFGFLLVGLVPLLICTVFLLTVFGGALNQNAAEATRAQLQAMGSELDDYFSACDTALSTLRSDALVRGALGGRRADGDQTVYSTLYQTPHALLENADFSLFDRYGRRRYSTGTYPRAGLPTDWGVLRAARKANGTVFRGVSYRSETDVILEAAAAVWEGGLLRGYVVMETTAPQLERLLDGKYSDASGVMILDPHWRAVYSSHSIHDETLVSRLRTRLMAGSPLSDRNSEFYYYQRPCGNTGLTLLIQQPKPLAAWMMRLLYFLTGVTILLCAGLCAAVSMGLSRQLFEPIRALNDAMGEVETGNLEVRVVSRRTDEMGQLAGRFNRMVEKLSGYWSASLRQQQQVNNARIQMMQAQLNPHFLYNTLDTIKWIGKMNHIPEIATIAADLADILRGSISGEEFVALEDEVRLLERYVEIQKIRFPGKFEFTIDIGEGTRDALIPKLMLQPLVENAIVHGFEDGTQGKITVSAVRQEQELVLTVLDNGCGMSVESLERFKAQAASGEGHLGLYNVDAILRLHYGSERGLHFLPVCGAGTLIRISLPITRKETPEC